MVLLLFSRGVLAASSRRNVVSISRSFNPLRSFDPLRSRVRVKSRVWTCRQRRQSLPFMTVDVMCLSVDDVVASAPGFDRSLHRSNARREIHGRMTIDPFQTSDRSIDRNPFLPLYIVIGKGKSPIAATTPGDWKKEAKNFQKTHTQN